MSLVRSSSLALAVLSTSFLGCGDDSVDGAGGSGATTNASNGTMPTQPAVTGVSAPTQTTVRIELTVLPDDVPLDPKFYELTSDLGPLTADAVTVDAATATIVLSTPKQKLGVEYVLAIKKPGSELDLMGGKFLAADTAEFWATDFADFDDYQLVARRVGVGEHVVIYVDESMSATDIDSTIADFDDNIFPIETALFHAAPDRDENGRIVLLGLDGGGFYGGYFSPSNALTEDDANSFGTHSNETEMLYLSVPDLGGAIDSAGVLAHEFTHLLYNEAHDFTATDWSWHNEGLAECGVHAVYGVNEYAQYYYTDPSLGLATGQSLVIWEYANYSQYAQAYVFWTYAASRGNGVQSYGDFFAQSGDPADMDAFFTATLGRSFQELQLDMVAAAFRQEPTGPLGFSGMLMLSDTPLTVPAGMTGVDLKPYTTVLFDAPADGVTPTGQGVDMIHLGVPLTGALDPVAPFDVAGGVILAHNARVALDDVTEPTGAVGPPASPPPPLHPALPTDLAKGPVWLHPPPVKPANMPALRAFRKRTAGF